MGGGRGGGDGIVLCPDCACGCKILYVVTIRRTNEGVVFHRYVAPVGGDKHPGGGLG